MSIFTKKPNAFNGKLHVHPFSLLLIVSSMGMLISNNSYNSVNSFNTSFNDNLNHQSPPRQDYFIRGFVKEVNGTILKDIFVYLKFEDQIIDTCKSDSLGMYEFVRLKPGEYKLMVNSAYHAQFEDSIEIESIDLYFDIQLKAIRMFNGCIISRSSTKEIALTKTGTSFRTVKTGLRNGSSIANYASGTTETRNGIVGRGSRTDGTAVYIDGVRVNNGSLNTEEYKSTDENVFFKTSKEPVSTFSSDVDYASYTNVRRMINESILPPVDAVRVEEFINYFDYAYEEPKDENDISMKLEQSYCPWNSTHQLVKIGLRAKTIAKEQMLKNNLVFLIDVSGSMSDDNKLPWVKYALKLMAKNLNPTDMISIVTYAGYTSLALEATSCNNYSKIEKVIDGLGAGGSTAGASGINMAYSVAASNFVEGGNNRIILVTDGDFNVGITGESELKKLVEEKRKSGVYLTVCGFGMGNLKDSRMEMLADNGNGSYYYIDQLSEAERVFKYGLSSTLMTMAKDVKIQVEFNPKYVQAYRLIGYENRILAYEDFKNDAKDAGDMGAGQTVTALYEIVPVGVDMQDTNQVELKYSKLTSLLSDTSNEILTLKIRYKKPNQNSSIELSEVLKANQQSSASATDDMKLASSVAMFGMLLSGSEFSNNANYKTVLEMLPYSENQKVKEFLALVKKMDIMN